MNNYATWNVLPVLFRHIAMTVNSVSRHERREPIAQTYGDRPTNDDAQHMIWFNQWVSDETRGYRNVVAIVPVQIIF